MTTVHCSTVHFASRCHERWKIIEDWHISCRPLVFFAPRRLWRWSKKSRCFHFPPDGFPTRSQSRNNKSLQPPWRQTGELIKSLLFFLASVWCHMYPDTHHMYCVFLSQSNAFFLFLRWPTNLETSINAQEPLDIPGEDTSVYLSSSPPPFCPDGNLQLC